MVNRTSILIDFECAKGEAVFQSPLMETTDKPFKKLLIELQTYLEHIDDLKGDRLLVLTSDLLVENVVDKYLSTIMPSYEKELQNNRECTFFFKICVAKALKLTPIKIFDAANIIRKVRNAFAHTLEIKDFSNLDEKLLREMDKNQC